MPYRTFNLGQHLFIRWEQPHVDDLDKLIAATAEVRRAVKGPLVIFSVIPAGAAPPDAAFRKQIVARWSSIMPESDTVHAVLEGSGIGASLNRAVLTAIRMFVRGRGIGKIYSSLDDALHGAGLGSQAVRKQLRDAKIID